MDTLNKVYNSLQNNLSIIQKETNNQSLGYDIVHNEKYKLRHKDKLNQFEIMALKYYEDHTILDQVDDDELIKLTYNVECVSELRKEVNLLRASYAGWLLRSQKSKNGHNEVFNEDNSTSKQDISISRVQKENSELRKKAEELESEILAGIDETMNVKNEYTNRRRKLEEMEEHLLDLKSALSSIESTSARKKRNQVRCNINEREKSLAKEISEARSRCETARAECKLFEEQAADFEKKKSEACSRSSELQELSKCVLDTQNNVLGPLQEKTQIQQSALKMLKAAIKRILETTLQHVDEKNTTLKEKECICSAAALNLLLENGGEMGLDDWKANIARTPPYPASSDVIHTVYDLVAKKLVTIDRSLPDSRVVSLVTL